MTGWMTYDQALKYAITEAQITGRRYTVYKSRAVTGWWNVVQLTQPLGGQLKARRSTPAEPQPASSQG